MSLLDTIRGTVVGRSKVNEFNHAVEIDADQFDQIISELYALEALRKRNGELERSVAFLEEQIEPQPCIHVFSKRNDGLYKVERIIGIDRSDGDLDIYIRGD